jgi:hypothetical protein
MYWPLGRWRLLAMQSSIGADFPINGTGNSARIVPKFGIDAGASFA